MRFNNLQAARTVAAAVVLVAHAGNLDPQLYGGWNPFTLRPVQYWISTANLLFFALSGFVMAHALQRASFRAFLVPRLLRLYLGLWAAFLLVWLAGVASGGRYGLPTPALSELPWLLVLWPNHHPAPLLSGVEWTLRYEVFFSLAIVPLAALGRRRGMLIGATVWMAVCMAGMYRVVSPLTMFPGWYDLPLSPVNITFLLGVIVYFGRDALEARRPAVFLVTALALTGGAALYGVRPLRCFLLHSLGSALLVGLAATGRQLGERSSLVRSGEWSYGVYLLHAPVLILGHRALVDLGMPPTASLVIFVGVAAFAVGSAFGACESAVYRRLKAALTPRRPAAEVVGPRLAA